MDDLLLCAPSVDMVLDETKLLGTVGALRDLTDMIALVGADVFAREVTVLELALETVSESPEKCLKYALSG